MTDEDKEVTLVETPAERESADVIAERQREYEEEIEYQEPAQPITLGSSVQSTPAEIKEYVEERTYQNQRKPREYNPPKNTNTISLDQTEVDDESSDAQDASMWLRNTGNDRPSFEGGGRIGSFDNFGISGEKYDYSDVAGKPIRTSTKSSGVMQKTTQRKAIPSYQSGSGIDMFGIDAKSDGLIRMFQTPARQPAKPIGILRRGFDPGDAFKITQLPSKSTQTKASYAQMPISKPLAAINWGTRAGIDAGVDAKKPIVSGIFGNLFGTKTRGESGTPAGKYPVTGKKPGVVSNIIADPLGGSPTPSLLVSQPPVTKKKTKSPKVYHSERISPTPEINPWVKAFGENKIGKISNALLDLDKIKTSPVYDKHGNQVGTASMRKSPYSPEVEHARILNSIKRGKDPVAIKEQAIVQENERYRNAAEKYKKWKESVDYKDPNISEIKKYGARIGGVPYDEDPELQTILNSGKKREQKQADLNKFYETKRQILKVGAYANQKPVDEAPPEKFHGTDVYYKLTPYERKKYGVKQPKTVNQARFEEIKKAVDAPHIAKTKQAQEYGTSLLGKHKASNVLAEWFTIGNVSHREKKIERANEMQKYSYDMETLEEEASKKAKETSQKYQEKYTAAKQKKFTEKNEGDVKNLLKEWTANEKMFNIESEKNQKEIDSNKESMHRFSVKSDTAAMVERLDEKRAEQSRKANYIKNKASPHERMFGFGGREPWNEQHNKAKEEELYAKAGAPPMKIGKGLILSSLEDAMVKGVKDEAGRYKKDLLEGRAARAEAERQRRSVFWAGGLQPVNVTKANPAGEFPGVSGKTAKPRHRNPMHGTEFAFFGRPFGLPKAPARTRRGKIKKLTPAQRKRNSRKPKSFFDNVFGAKW